MGMACDRRGAGAPSSPAPGLAKVKQGTGRIRGDFVGGLDFFKIAVDDLNLDGHFLHSFSFFGQSLGLPR
jgi:hypothetical protein